MEKKTCGKTKCSVGIIGFTCNILNRPNLTIFHDYLIELKLILINSNLFQQKRQNIVWFTYKYIFFPEKSAGYNTYKYL